MIQEPYNLLSWPQMLILLQELKPTITTETSSSAPENQVKGCAEKEAKGREKGRMTIK